jgi:hypothetical protein
VCIPRPLIQASVDNRRSRCGASARDVRGTVCDSRTIAWTVIDTRTINGTGIVDAIARAVSHGSLDRSLHDVGDDRVIAILN